MLKCRLRHKTANNYPIIYLWWNRLKIEEYNSNRTKVEN